MGQAQSGQGGFPGQPDQGEKKDQVSALATTCDWHAQLQAYPHASAATLSCSFWKHETRASHSVVIHHRR